MSMVTRHDELLAYRNFAVAFHDANLDVLFAGLNDLEKALHSELDRVVPAQVVLVVLLEELPHSLGRPTDGIGL